MAQFSTAAELAANLGLTFSVAESTRADTLLQQASRLIQGAAKQTIELVTGDSLTRPSTFEDRVRLPQRPVVSVTSVSLDGVLVDPTSWYLNGDEICQRSGLSDQFFAVAGRGWGGPSHTLNVVYTHGYAPASVPEIVKTICREAVIRVWANPGRVVEEQVGNTRTLYSSRMGATSPGGMLLTDDEIKQLTDLLRRTAGSVQLR